MKVPSPRAAAAAALLAAALAAPPAADAADPVLALSFDEGIGTTASDASGLANHGTVDGASWVAGHTGGALSFDGVDDLVSVAHDASLDIGTSGTVEAWVRPDVAAEDKPVLAKGDLFGLYADYMGGVSAWSDIDWFTTPYDLPVGEWSHVAGTFDDNGATIYVDGQVVAHDHYLGRWHARSVGDPLWIGATQWWYEFFEGRIDDVRVYDSALTATEVAADAATPVT
jgi:hypothetical protein